MLVHLCLSVAVIKQPPYEVNESGYGSFEIIIEVHFRNKSEPRKAEIKYDLWLATGSFDPVTNQHPEKMKFYDVPEDFANRLFKAGGVSIHHFVFTILLCLVFSLEYMC